MSDAIARSKGIKEDQWTRTEDTNAEAALWERATRTSAGTVSWAERMLHSPADAAASEQSPHCGLQQTLPSTAEAAEARSWNMVTFQIAAAEQIFVYEAYL